MPTGYKIEIGGEYAKQQTGFGELGVILLISCLMIYVALVIQFNSAIKPVLVFACVPYGVVGALLALLVMGTPFGFMAFLGIASLIGVIVSHVIVLFDFIEEMHEKGEPFMEAVLDAGIERLRPVLITVGAAVLALVPLSIRGGPLWEPLCYAQIGGLSVATFIELLLVPVFYGIFVLDLKIIKWETIHPDAAPGTVIPLRGTRIRRSLSYAIERSLERAAAEGEPSPAASKAASPDTEWPKLLARVVEGIVTAELHEFEDNVMEFLDSAVADASATFIRVCAWVIGAAFLLTGLTLFAGKWMEWWAAFASVGVVVIALGSIAGARRYRRRRRSHR